MKHQDIYISVDNRILMLQHLPDQFNKKAVEALSTAKKNIHRLISKDRTAQTSSRKEVRPTC
jgi:hypothetical protein